MSAWPLRILVYGAGEAINGGGALDVQIADQLSRLQTVATNRIVAAAAQLDSSSAESIRFVLDPAGGQPLEPVGETNSGDPAELARFVDWAVSLLPADRTVLVLSGHGTGWLDTLAAEIVGTRLARPPVRHANTIFSPRRAPLRVGPETRAILFDESSHDFLSNAELAAACEQVAGTLGHPIDALVMDACLMMTWEIAHELVGTASTVVGSVDELSAAGIDLSGPAYALSTHFEATPAGIAALFPAHFAPQAPFDSCVAVDLSSTDWLTAIDHFAALSSRLAAWVEADLPRALRVKDAFTAASASITKFRRSGIADVAALLGAVAAISGLPAEVAEIAGGTLDALRRCVLGKSTGADYAGALGISIFVPDSEHSFNRNIAEYNRLRFSSRTGWGALLEAVFRPGVTRTPAPRGVEYRVTLRGVDLKDAVRSDIGAALQRVAAEKLAEHNHPPEPPPFAWAL